LPDFFCDFAEALGDRINHFVLIFPIAAPLKSSVTVIRLLLEVCDRPNLPALVRLGRRLDRLGELEFLDRPEVDKNHPHPSQ
jgi:hypothetical protein